MKCPTCFKEFADGQRFCPYCGQEFIVDQNAMNDNLVRAEETPEYMPPAPDNAELIREELPKRGNALKIALSIAGVLLAFVVAFFCFKDAIVGFCMRNFSDPVSYFSYVEGKAFGDAAENFFEDKREAEKEVSKGGGVATAMKLKIADDVSFLFGELDESFEDILYWLDDFGIVVDSDYKDGKISYKVSASAQNEKLLDAGLVIDEEGNIYFSIPTFSDQFVQLNDETQEKVNYNKILPEDAVLEDLANRYYRILFQSLTDVTAEKGVYVRGDGVEEEAYVITVRVTEKQLHATLVALVAEAKGDVELKKLYDDFTSAFVESELLHEDEVQSWEEFIEEAEEYLEEAKESFEGEGEELFVLTDYINSKHEIVGRKITTVQEESFLFAYYMDERDVDFVLTAGEVDLRAAGEVVDDHAAVTGTLEFGEIKVLNLKLNWGDEDLTLRMTLTEEMKDQIVELLGGEENLGKFYDYMDLGIEMIIDGDDDELKTEVSVLVSEKKKITISTEAKEKPAEKVEIPAEEKVYSADEMEEWSETFKLDAFLEALEKSGFPVDVFS